MLNLIRKTLGMPEQEKIIQRGAPADPPEARAALVKNIISEVKADEKHWEKRFEKMRKSMEFARHGGEKEWANSDKYVANMVQRQIKNTVAALYAKNPKAVARPADRRMFRVWDERAESMQMALQDMASGMPTPQSIAIIQDIAEGQSYQRMVSGLGETLVTLFHYYLRESQPSFKRQAKQLVRRTVTTGVGYIKQGYQRSMELSIDQEERLNDITQRIATIERLRAELIDGEVHDTDAEYEELQQALKALQASPEHIVREGLVYSFPKSTSIIPDRACTQLQGFIGAGRVTQVYLLKPERVKELFKIELGQDQFTRYTGDGTAIVTVTDDKKYLCKIYEVYDKSSGVVYTVCDGYPDFLEEPGPPEVQTERFWPYHVLTFNDIEDDSDIFPPSDPELMRSMQLEHNRSREALREHRQAATPFYVSSAGSLTEEDKNKISTRMPHEILDLVGLPPGTDAATIVQQMKLAGIDPNLYETSHLFEDILRTTGGQEANFGATGGDSATEVSVAESSRLSSVDSSMDDVDDMLTELARDAGQILLMEMSQETVMKIVGPGAIWPQFSGQEMAEEVMLEIEAGSSGKPNAEREAAIMERFTPLLVQLPGLSPEWLMKRMLKSIDTNIDITEAYVEGMPSITAMNGMMSGAGGQPGTGDPATDPSSQGGQGGNNAPVPDQATPGPQAAYPAGGMF